MRRGGEVRRENDYGLYLFLKHLFYSQYLIIPISLFLGVYIYHWLFLLMLRGRWFPCESEDRWFGAHRGETGTPFLQRDWHLFLPGSRGTTALDLISFPPGPGC